MENFDSIFRYMIVDIEVFYDYLSFQFKSESMNGTKIYECYNDSDCIELYKKLKHLNRPMYVYSLDFDSVIINSLCKLVEKNKTNILFHLRIIANYLIQYKIDYTIINREFWCNCYFKLKESYPELQHDDLCYKSLSKLKHMYSDKKHIISFLEKYSFLLGKSKVYKKLIVNSIPKILKYTATDKNCKVKMTISLKKLQLIKEGYNVKFDFDKYERIEDVKKDGLYEEFVEYSKNDVDFLERLFLEQPKKEIMDRWYAYLAVSKIKPDFEIDYVRDLFSETNTNIICKILKIDDPNKDFEIDYTDYINTNEPRFNNWLKYVNNNKNKSEDKIKEGYKKLYNETNISMLKWDEIKVKDIIVKLGFGGSHGALNNYVGENLIHLDYTSLYPSIVLQHKELFKNIMNVDLYEAVYNMRNKEIKPKLKTLDKRTKEYKELYKLQLGIKLILNSSYGLINKTCDITISCKKLGMFVTLVGQSLLLNLSSKILKYDKDVIFSNYNTDGLILKSSKDMMPIVEDDKNGYFTLGIDKVDKIIQKDVNNYIKIIDGEIKTKGVFNLSIKQHINKHERISVNTMNALKLLDSKNVEILPIYFDTKWINKEDKAYYFTTKEYGEVAIKKTKNEQVLETNYEPFYFTDDKKYAKIELYKKYAEVTKNSILNFSFIHKKISGTKPLEGQISMF